MIYFLLFLMFGDPSALGSREYAEREAAQSRLERGGWLAAPLLWRGMQADEPEVAERCSVAWAGLMAKRSLPVVVCRAIDATGRFEKDRDSWRWVQLKPYLNGSMENDLLYAVRRATPVDPVTGR